MALNWEHIVLNFVSNGDMDFMLVSEAEGEKALCKLARSWDKDCISAVRGNLGEEEDVEMDQLEDYVMRARKEDRGERARREDGIASMGCCFILKINSLVPRAVAISDGYASVGEDEEWENGGPQLPFVEDGLAVGIQCKGWWSRCDSRGVFESGG